MKASIAWLVPRPIKGSGGIREIYNKIQYLCDQGMDCHVFVEGEVPRERLVEQIEAFYGAVDCVVHAGWESRLDEFDVLFATAWNSPRVLASYPEKKRAYMVQDYEAWFNPMSDGYVVAERSYQLGLVPTCLGRWLPNKLHREYGIVSRYFDFCCDRRLYQPQEPYAGRELSICYIHQPEKPRRCSQIGIEALALAKRAIPELSVYLYGSDSTGDVPFAHTNLGILKPERINELYNRCTLGLCISASNPSRIPFEMMATGLPVIDIHRENNVYDFPDSAMRLAADDARSIARAIVDVLRDSTALSSMSEAGTAWMADRSMEFEFRQFHAAVCAVIAGDDGTGRELPGKLYQQPPIDVSRS